MMFSIPAGTLVSIARQDKRWRAHKMRKTVQAPEYRDSTTWGSSGAVIVQVAGWFIMLRRAR